MYYAYMEFEFLCCKNRDLSWIIHENKIKRGRPHKLILSAPASGGRYETPPRRTRASLELEKNRAWGCVRPPAESLYEGKESESNNFHLIFIFRADFLSLNHFNRFKLVNRL